MDSIASVFIFKLVQEHDDEGQNGKGVVSASLRTKPLSTYNETQPASYLAFSMTHLGAHSSAHIREVGRDAVKREMMERVGGWD